MTDRPEDTVLQAAQEGPRPHRLTVEDYYRMAEAGILGPDDRVELIEGEIIDMAPTGSLHAGEVDELASLLRAAVDERAILRIQGPVSLGRYSQPEPDILLLRPRADYYRSAHPAPADVLLLVEIAVTSLHYDREVKLPLYARHGVTEVWLLEAENRQLTRYRNPRDGAYARIDQPDLRVPLEIGALPGVRVDLAPLSASK